MTNEKRLFNYINSVGVYNGDTFIMDNTGAYGKQRGEKHYIVLAIGGLRFDISKELNDDQEPAIWDYSFMIVWEGPLNITTAKEALEYLYFINRDNKHFSQPANNKQ